MALLKSFEQPTQAQLEMLWREGLFVFDTSLLLNLHRYRDSAREDFIKGIATIKDQVWIPFQVALEYELNRPKVISDKRRVIEKSKLKVQSIVDEVRGRLSEVGAFRRHSHVDAEEFIKRIEADTKDFCHLLDELGRQTPDVVQPDQIRAKISELFAGRIGDPPATQGDIKALDELANSRFSIGYPPGYLDQQKDSSKEGAAYSFGGLVYQRKNGDLYLWDQIKKKAASSRATAVCLITDDQKEDWWWMIDSEGKKRLGPRPELKEEIQRESGVEVFYMYGPDSFLESLNRFRHLAIQQDSISEARELSQERRLLKAGSGQFGNLARRGVERWCKAKSSTGKLFPREFPDFVEFDSEDAIVGGFEVIPVIAPVLDVEQRIERRIQDIQNFVEANPAAVLRLMFVFNDLASAKSQMPQVREYDGLPSSVSKCVGYMAGPLYRHLKCFIELSVSDSISFK